MHNYWAQWSHNELMSWHGLELDELKDSDEEFEDFESEDKIPECEYCRFCLGHGCNDCLMIIP